MDRFAMYRIAKSEEVMHLYDLGLIMEEIDSALYSRFIEEGIKDKPLKPLEVFVRDILTEFINEIMTKEMR